MKSYNLASKISCALTFSVLYFTRYIFLVLKKKKISILFFFKEFYYTQYIQGCTRINYKIVPVTNFDKYLHYGTSGNE